MHNRASLILGVGLMLLAGWAAFAALDWPWKAKLFPLVISVPLFVLAAVEVAWTLLRPGAQTEAKDFQLSTEQPAGVTLRRTAGAFAWIAGFLALIVLAGFPVAVPVFLLAYLKLQGKESWTMSLVVSAVVFGIFYALFDRMLHLPFPDGWILSWFASG